MKQAARVIFITICGLINFIYLVVSPFKVFDFLIAGSEPPTGGMSLPAHLPLTHSGTGGAILAASDSLWLLPLYLLAVFLVFGGMLFFISMIIEIPSMIARFYIDRLGDYLFIDVMKTIRFFVMLLLPVAYYATVFAGGGAGKSDLMKDMVLNTMAHTGIVLLILTVTAFREGVTSGAEGRFRAMKIACNIYVAIILVAVTFVMFAGPYLAFYHIETDPIRVGVFHVFLIYSLYTNYRFYRDNNIIRRMGTS